MKRADKSAKATGNLDLFISTASVGEILKLPEMLTIRGGEGYGNNF